MKIGLATTKTDMIEWLDLGLSSLEQVSEVLEVQKLTPKDPVELLIIDAENPGPSFVHFYRELCSNRAELPQIVVLGDAGAPVMMSIEWSPERSIFISSPYKVEDVMESIRARFDSVGGDISTETKNSGGALSYLSTLRLSDLIQMLALNLWNGKIEIQELTNHLTGEIYLNSGVLVHSHVGDLQAEEACYEMLTWGRCKFQFFEEHAPIVQNITSTWEEILIEGARRMDEQQSKSA